MIAPIEKRHVVHGDGLQLLHAIGRGPENLIEARAGERRERSYATCEIWNGDAQARVAVERGKPPARGIVAAEQHLLLTAGANRPVNQVQRMRTVGRSARVSAPTRRDDV